ncbi:MAG TPA: 2'-5' RNA ligase family protein [Caldilineaceae bacterium]|nr:2'-5' RNA ligase family protein [Caldilineaceae bacterium]
MSIHILLPEVIDRRFERWAKKMPGASWPAWGGHITLVPSFVPVCPQAEVQERVARAVSAFAPFRVSLSEPEAVQDWTRPQYKAVMLKVDDLDSEDHQELVRLQAAIAQALAPVRTQVRPELADQPFVPHLTLALGLSENEAAKLVNAIRADPVEAEFVVDGVWLVVMTPSDGSEPKVRRIPIQLGKAPLPVGMLSD